MFYYKIYKVLQYRKVEIQVISSLGLSKSETYLPDLHDLLDDPDSKIRKAVVEALGNIGYPKSIKLLHKTVESNDLTCICLAAVKSIGKIGTQEGITALMEILKNEKGKEIYQTQAVKELHKILPNNALDTFLNSLKKEDNKKQDRRKTRDGGYQDEKKWKKRLEKYKPKPYLEYELAYAITQIAPEKEGIKLLSHNLAAVREGAWKGIGKIGTVELLKKLHEQRNQSKFPWFRHAAYRAIDNILIKLEVFGEKKDLQKLEKFFLTAVTEKQNPGVHTRVEWTVNRLNHRLN